jgi:PAS domain S-box-containing protein
MPLQTKSTLALSPAAGWTSAALAGYALLGGTATLLGWILDAPGLASWGAGSEGIVTQPNTALAALGTGAALVCVVVGRERAAQILALAVAAIGGLTLLEHVAQIDLGIDRVLLFDRPWGALATTSPGRMGPPAATAYLMLGAGVLLSTGPVGGLARFAASVLGLGVCAIGLLSCSGYLFAADTLYDLARYTAIAPQTATIVLALGLGLVGTIPEREPTRALVADSGAGVLARRALPFLVLGPVFLGWLRLLAQDAQLIDTAMGTALLVICLIAMLCALLWRGVALLDQREDALAAAHRLSARADMVLRSARDQVIIFDRNWRCAYVNDRMTDLTGLSRERLLELKLWEVWPDIAGTELERAARRVMQSREAESLEHRDPLSERWYDAHFSPVPDGNVALVVLEISERKRAEQALKDSEQRFRLAAEAVRGIIYEVDFATGNWERSQGLYDVLGHRVSDVPATTRWWREQIHPDDRVATDARFIEAAASGRTIVNGYRMRHRDGRWLHIEDRAVLLKDDDGTLLKMWGCAIDVTQQKEAQNRIFGLLDALQEADQKKDEFIATLAHELRNPLAPIRTSIELLNRAGDDRALAERAQATMSRQVAQMVRLIDDLLDVSRITHDKLELKKEVVDLRTVVEHALDTCRPLVDAAHQELSVRLPSEPVKLSADPARLAQILGNLLTNASKYTSAEGRIWFTAERQNGEVVLRVKDSGIGIRRDMLPRVFDMFTRLPDADGKPGGGLGIGLALVKRLVEMHDGQVSAHSEGPGRGSEFCVRLPVLHDAEARVGTLEQSAPVGALVGRRILIVDDNRDAAESLAELLEVTGHTLATAHDGIEAVETAEAFQPEIILLDIGLPGMDGYECCRTIRKQPWGRPIWIVGTTGWGQDEDRRKSKQAGFDAHLVKPVDPRALLNLIATLPPTRPDDA